MKTNSGPVTVTKHVRPGVGPNVQRVNRGPKSAMVWMTIVTDLWMKGWNLFHVSARTSSELAAERLIAGDPEAGCAMQKNRPRKYATPRTTIAMVSQMKVSWITRGVM